MMIADLHIHSKYSRATSRDCDLEHLELWARRKGIGVLGTGDFTHPAWREEMRQKLVPAEEGLYTLKEEYRLPAQVAGEGEAPRFLVTGEISSIYKKRDRVRKVHSLILLPGLEAAEELSRKLEAIGNIHSDGRPILGLDCHDLLEILLETCPEGEYIPAHIWTPHFSLFGAFSGFDSLEECYGDLTGEIHAAETGLSSDPPMNWRVSGLDGLTLVSNSDAHSPAKLGREANLLSTELAYPAIRHAIQKGREGGFRGTLEFFPEEGKYHFDGHRNCKVCLHPAETGDMDGRCPVCGRKMTIGVLHRVCELADRAEGYQPENALPFESLVPLPEVIAASTGKSAASVRVREQYEKMLAEIGPEFHILREAPIEEIRQKAGLLIAEGIERLRSGRVERTPGYDGEYGKIEILRPEDMARVQGQLSFFAEDAEKTARKQAAPAGIKKRAGKENSAAADEGEQLNAEQRAAVCAEDRRTAVIAGPGTGKTKTLVARIAHLVEQGTKPGEITAVTFTRKAAAEMRERLAKSLADKRAARALHIGTFHSLCLELLEQMEGRVSLLNPEEAQEIAEEILTAQESPLSPRRLLEGVSRWKNGQETQVAPELLAAYQARLEAAGQVDFDDLLKKTLELWEKEIPSRLEKRFSHLLVDEFQDCNALQNQLIHAWGEKAQSVFVIGDPDQAIYGFRGADTEGFRRLKEEFPELRQIRLRKNYRSTPEILDCALPVIQAGDGVKRELEALRPSGVKVRLVQAQSDLQEGIFIAKEINRLMGGVDMLDAQAYGERGKPLEFSDIAVLYRTHRQAEILETCLKKEGIAFAVTGRESYLADSAVRGTLAFFRALLQPGDKNALAACWRHIWKVKKGEVEDLLAQAPEAADLAEICREFEGREAWLDEWIRMAERFGPRAAREKPWKLLKEWRELRPETEGPALERLEQAAVLSPKMPEFLQTVLLGQEQDIKRQAAKYAAGAVQLQTFHGAKGLEYPVVFLCGVEQGKVPLERKGRAVDREEERRLLYVGLTRAKEELILTCAGEPSDFLGAISRESLKMEQAARPRSTGKQMSLFDMGI